MTSRLGPLLALVTVALTACGPKSSESSEAAPPPSAKPCPDVNNRDRNDPCSPLYFKKKGSGLPDKDSF